MQGQHGNTTIIEIVQEDFVETPGGEYGRGGVGRYGGSE